MSTSFKRFTSISGNNFLKYWLLHAYSYILCSYNGSLFAFLFYSKIYLTAHKLISTAIANCAPPTIQPRACPSAQLWRRETRQSRKRQSLGWVILWGWRSERLVKIWQWEVEGWARIRHLLRNFLATPFLCCCHIILMQIEVIAEFWGAFFPSERDKHQDRLYHMARFWQIHGDGGSPLQIGDVQD